MDSTQSPAQQPVSPNNPCPFLRALVADGRLSDDREPLGKVVATVVDAARAGESRTELPAAAIRAIALIANGLGLLQIARNARHGLRLNQLRNGPLDKKGVGSGILDATGTVDAAQLDRLGEFASDKTDAEGRSEPGLDLAEIKRFMDANFARAAGRRRRIDRKLMDGEWPVLLRVMGKRGPRGRYLALADVRELFVNRRLPARIR